MQDVKPNGLILVEARESIQSDGEIKTMVLSGLCDPKDITNANTVQSSQYWQTSSSASSTRAT